MTRYPLSPRMGFIFRVQPSSARRVSIVEKRSSPGKKTVRICQRKGGFLIRETAIGRCGVRSGTDSPCLRLAALEIGGVPFCERCAREQEAYFAVGELTQALAANRAEQSRRFRRNEPLVGRLVETLRKIRGVERAGRAVRKDRAKAAAGNR